MHFSFRYGGRGTGTASRTDVCRARCTRAPLTVYARTARRTCATYTRVAPRARYTRAPFKNGGVFFDFGGVVLKMVVFFSIWWWFFPRVSAHAQCARPVRAHRALCTRAPHALYARTARTVRAHRAHCTRAPRALYAHTARAHRSPYAFSKLVGLSSKLVGLTLKLVGLTQNMKKNSKTKGSKVCMSGVFCALRGTRTHTHRFITVHRSQMALLPFLHSCFFLVWSLAAVIM